MPLYNPAFGPGTGSNYLQSSFAIIAADSTTTSASFVAVGAGLSVTITTVAGSKLNIWFAASPSNTANNGTEIDFQILIDSVATIGCGTGTKSNGVPQTCGINFVKTGLSAGSHTITVQWRTASGTAQIRPVTTIIESATLLVAEVSN